VSSVSERTEHARLNGVDIDSEELISVRLSALSRTPIHQESDADRPFSGPTELVFDCSSEAIASEDLDSTKTEVARFRLVPLKTFSLERTTIYREGRCKIGRNLTCPFGNP